MMTFGNRRVSVSIVRKAWPTRLTVHHTINDVGVHIWLVSWRRTVVVLTIAGSKVQE